jgi:hypothetical protein
MRVNSANKMIVEDGVFSMLKVNSLMYQSSGDKCKNIDDSWCLVNKKWCCLVPGCDKKNPTKVQVSHKNLTSGEKYIYFNKASGKWHLQFKLNGVKKSFGKSYDLQELVKIRDEYLKGVKRG